MKFLHTDGLRASIDGELFKINSINFDTGIIIIIEGGRKEVYSLREAEIVYI